MGPVEAVVTVAFFLSFGYFFVRFYLFRPYGRWEVERE